MNEQQRVAYLRSMGYQVYYPKFLLPGAKPSPHYELPEPTKPDSNISAQQREGSKHVSGGQVDSSAKTAAARSALATPRTAGADKSNERRMRRDASAASGASAASAPTNSSVTRSEASPGESNEFRFSLQYFAVNESLAVVNETPFHVAGKQGKEIRELLTAILAALGVQASPQGLHAEQFVWPLAEGLDVMGDSRRAAGLALKGFISQRREQDGFKNLLVFTAQLGDLLGPEGNATADHYGDHPAEAAAYNLTISHSLPAMLAHPQLKREVWAHLQELRLRLNLSP